MSTARHPDLAPAGGGRAGTDHLEDRIEKATGEGVESIPVWRVMATARARRLADGRYLVRCLNDLGHAVDIVFSGTDWEWATTRGV